MKLIATVLGPFDERNYEHGPDEEIEFNNVKEYVITDTNPSFFIVTLMNKEQHATRATEVKTFKLINQ